MISSIEKHKKKVTPSSLSLQFIGLTFCIAYLVSGVLILCGQFGYTVYNWVHSLREFGMNIPFAIYILSPAIASFLVLKKNKRVSGLIEWLQTVFYVKNTFFSYLFVVVGLTLYFSIHILVSGRFSIELPFYTILLSIPGNLFIGGLEEAGWMFVLQPELDKRYGHFLSSVMTGIIWIFWHIPLFFLPGTNHGEGLINFWMFAVQLMAFRFFNGAIYKISGKGCVFMCVLFHTLFNAASPVFGTMTMTWTGTLSANAVLVIMAILTVKQYNHKNKQHRYTKG